jgi:hypothetical protein
MDGIIGTVAAGRVRQQGIFFQIDEVQERLLVSVQVYPADSNGNDLGPGSLQRLHHLFIAGVFAGSHHQAGVELVEFASGNDQLVVVL